MKATVKFVMWVLLGAAVVHGCLSAVASCAHAEVQS